MKNYNQISSLEYIKINKINLIGKKISFSTSQFYIPPHQKLIKNDFFIIDFLELNLYVLPTKDLCQEVEILDLMQYLIKEIRH